MYILMPEAFYTNYQINKNGEKEIKIFTSRFVEKGEQFLQYSGDWIMLQDENKQKQSKSETQERTINWLKLLTIKKNKNEVNACLKKVGHQVILEIIVDVPSRSQVIATDHSSYTQRSNILSDASHSPLDLTLKKTNVSTEVPEKTEKYIGQKEKMNISRYRKLLQCNVCDKFFDRPSLLKRHTRIHTGEKPHVCEVCNKGFSTSSSLNTHRRIHSGERPHQCCICGKKFTASSNLYYHKMTHSKEKPHKCQICGKSFPTPGNLKAHQYAHSGHWPFICDICGRGFGKQTNFRNHKILHSNQKSETQTVR